MRLSGEIMKAFTKTLWRMFKENKGRLIGNSLIVLISLALSAGLATAPELYEESLIANNYTNQNVPDIILKNKTQDGFSLEDVDEIKKEDNILDVLPLFQMDYLSDSSYYRISVQDLNSNVSKLTILEGKKPTLSYDFSKEIEVLALEGNRNRETYQLGDVVTLKLNTLEKMFPDLEEGDLSNLLGFDHISLKVVGIVSSPLYTSVQKENVMLEGKEEESISSAFFLEESLLPENIVVQIGTTPIAIPLKSMFHYTDMDIVYQKKSAYFSDEYKEEMDKNSKHFLAKYGEDKVSVLTLEENVSYNLFKTYNGKVKKLSYIFPIFFMVVCALVNLITISRLIKEERAMIATYLSLGVSQSKIIFKYVLFSSLSVLFGGVAGLAIGLPLVPFVVLPAYQSVFKLSNHLQIRFFNLSSYLLFSAVLLLSIGVTLYCSFKAFKETPASLMKREAPKPGKKILFERIPFLWNKLPFRYKSSFRNIFRQKKNLILTSLSVIGSTVLLMLGFGLLDISHALKDDALFGNVASSMGSISFVIILFALSMAIVVIYSLANMNIQDRQRELATLKVLGYHDKECSFYTFREIMIISIGSALLALPISALLMHLVFNWLDFGSVSDVQWYSYIFSFAIVILSTVLVNLLLYPKIKTVDMNDSLKTLD